ncbi:sugar ABC transporter permease [Leptolyngbyaceae cyanobacterium CCMR0082]|uniref:Sugar ABC transporter permease n=1 Tax=Adonisia turfae CCMR0082 TaxID=2304604 RepID=A0A6M0SGK1_9CYAN|nr:sugar ABC transporter permease [Adonisia turfae]NEZ67698.1 sugar ABC transporter permease [Adonisia turfae CCMR0082]
MTLVAPGRDRVGTRVKSRDRTPWIIYPLYLLPAFFLLLVFFVVPALTTIGISFTDWQLGSSSIDLIGLDNYKELFTDEVYRKSLINTLKLDLFVVPVSFFLALGLALAINGLKRFQGFWQTVYFLPVTTTLVAMAQVWSWILHPQFGMVAQLFKLFGLTPINWLNDQSVVLYTIGFISIWQLVGYYTVLFIAGLLNVPKELYEAALIDGARSPWDKFCHVTWPMLGPTSLFIFIITIIKSSQIFDTVKVLTQGGPNNASEILLYTLYSEGFEFFRTGLASAIATLFFAIMLLLTMYQMRVFEKYVHYR